LTARIPSLVLGLMLAFGLVPGPASAASDSNRVALVIGNSKYPDADSPLKEPVNDARDIAAELKRDGFDVQIGENLTGAKMKTALDQFYARITRGSVALLFFSGFGLQSNRESYLIPLDAQIWSEPDARRDGFPLASVLDEIHNRGAGVKIALIDASRRNPFERRFRPFSAGLAPVIAPNGTLVMYSAALSSVNAESDGDRGLFVQELLKQIAASSRTAEEALNRTRVGVTRASRGEQIPWISSSLAEDFSFRSDAAPSPSIARRDQFAERNPQATNNPPVVSPNTSPAAPVLPNPERLPSPDAGIISGSRVALVVGNSSYANIAPLTNPANDARLMADTLRLLGFRLVGDRAQLDLDKAGLDKAVQKFGTELQGADVGLFYYAGHGVQVHGSNYLVPVDANPTRESDVDFQMLDANLVLRQMADARTKFNLVILDACRNNPFGSRGLRAFGGGLAQVQAPEGTLISFATQPGSVALDGVNGGSPYTKALVRVMRQPGLDVFRTFNETGLAVTAATGGAQRPWISLSPIKGEFYFAGLPRMGADAR
jgi:uncharacterized caspase-like protein